MKKATILVTSLIQSDLAALYFEGESDGYSMFALDCTSQVFTDRTKLGINLSSLENQTWDNNDIFRKTQSEISESKLFQLSQTNTGASCFKFLEVTPR